MRILMKIFAIAFLALTINIIIQSESKAQSKKDFETELNTSSPTFSIIWQAKDDQGNDIGMMELHIMDRQNQLVGVKMQRLSDQVKGNDPIRPKVKIINVPEINDRTFKIAETMDELYQPVDNKKVFLIEYTILLEAMRIKYQ